MRNKMISSKHENELFSGKFTLLIAYINIYSNVKYITRTSNKVSIKALN